MRLASAIQWSVVAALTVLSLNAAGQSIARDVDAVQRVGPIRLHRPVERSLGAGQTDVFTVKVSAGEFLHVVVNAKGVDLDAALVDPAGHVVLTADNPSSRLFGALPASIIAVDRGVYEIRVVKSPRTSETGPYRIEVTDVHPPTAEDRVRLQAETEFYAAVVKERTETRQNRLDAIEGYTRAAGLWHSLHDDTEEALSLMRVGVIHLDLGDLQVALKFYDETLPLWRTAKDAPGEASSMVGMAEIYSATGENQKALDASNSSLSLAHTGGDRAGEALALQLLGILYYYGDDTEKALGYYDQSLTLRRAMGDRVNESNLLQGIGLVYRELGENQKALDDFNQSLALCRALGNREGEAAGLLNIAYAYRELGENQKALDDANQGLVLYRELGDRANEANSLREIGEAHLYHGDNQEAVDYGNQAYEIDHSIDDRRGEGASLNLLGFAHARLGEQEEALKYYSRALPEVIAAGQRIEQGWTLGNVGESYAALGEKQKALDAYVQALQIGRETANPSMQGNVLSDLMKYWDDNQNPMLAIFFGKQAVNQYQEIRRGNQGLEHSTQQQYLALVTSDYRRLADLLIAQGRLSEAEQILSLLKEQEYLDYVRRDVTEASQVNGSASLNPEEAAAEKRYHEISDKLTAIGVRRGDLLAKAALTDEEKKELDQLEKDIAVGNVEFERVLGEMAQQFAAKPSAAMRVEELRETQGIMEDLRDLPPGTVAILTIVGDDKYRTILRTPDVQKAYEYPITAADLNRKVSALREVLLNPRLDPRPQAEELYKILVGPMAEDLRQAHAHTLMWSLDGTLRYLPVSALYDGKQYLIENYRVSVMTLASTARLKDQPDVKRLGVGFGVTKASPGAPALPWVSAELAGIIATKPGDLGPLSGEVDLDDTFTQKSMRQALLKRYAVVHIASHFRFEPGNDAQSYLLLGNGEHLSLAELKTSANLFGGVQLLTLSACNTGMGDGTEVEGFGTLAQRQGAKAVVATLWPVADQSTSLLMQRFYRNWQSSADMTKLEALREAQLDLLHGSGTAGATAVERGIQIKAGEDGTGIGAPAFAVDPGAPYAHPYYWAPFFLMGNWL